MATASFEQKVKVFFDQADTGEGLTVGSLARCIRKACPNFKGSDADIAGMFLEIDTDKDKLITWDEFTKALYARNPKEVSRSELEDVFKGLDTDGSGKLDRAEMKRLIKELAIEMSDEALDALMEQADPNGDGVSYQEFLAQWSSGSQ